MAGARPVILLHGIFGFGRLKLGPIEVNYFGRIARALSQSGRETLSPSTLWSAPVEQRACRLKEIILPWLRQQTQKAVIVAHSMGGLDARYVISRLGLEGRVAALLTIATPHHGSPLADVCLESRAIRNLMLPLLDRLGLDMHGAADLTIRAAARFNGRIPDSPDVRYFSISAACPMDRIPLLFQFSHQIIHDKEGENDGMVSARSARWGTELATWPVHHLHAINRRFPIDCRCPIHDIAPLYVEALQRVEKEL